MFFLKNQHRVIQRNRVWYVETPTGYEGPFEDLAEAKDFARIRRSADFARLEFADLSDDLP